MQLDKSVRKNACQKIVSLVYLISIKIYYKVTDKIKTNTTAMTNKK